METFKFSYNSKEVVISSKNFALLENFIDLDVSSVGFLHSDIFFNSIKSIFSDNDLVTKVFEVGSKFKIITLDNLIYILNESSV